MLVSDTAMFVVEEGEKGLEWFVTAGAYEYAEKYGQSGIDEIYRILGYVMKELKGVAE